MNSQPQSMQNPEKIIIIEEKDGSFERTEVSCEESSQFKISKPKTLLGRIFLAIISLILVAGIFYLAILFSVFILLLSLVLGVVSFLVMRFRKKDIKK